MKETRLLNITGLIVVALVLSVTVPLHGQPPNLQDREKISLELVNANLQHVLRLLAKQNDLNIITNERVEGQVTVNFQQVSLQSALDAILLSNGYNYVIHNDIIIIKELQREMQGEVETRVFELDYVHAEDLVTSLENVITEDRGTIDIFNRSIASARGTSGGQTGTVSWW